MADGGLLLNFATTSIAAPPKEKFVGGRWRDRVVAKKLAARRTAKISQHPTERALLDTSSYSTGKEDYIGEKDDSRAPKRQRIEDRAVDGSAVQPRGQRPVSSNTGTQNDSSRAAFMSGKLPSGAITGLATKSKKFDQEDEASGSKHVLPQSLDRVKDRAALRPTTKRKEFTTTASSAQSAQQGVISSLFTFNPEAKTKFDTKPETTEPAVPSNAPLNAELETFVTLGLSVRVAGHLSSKMDLKAPTAIQKAAIPVLVSDDNDAFLQAQTGSGKTLAYLLPIVERLVALSTGDTKIHRDSGLFAVIMAPTRELCKQITDVLEKLLRCCPWIVGTSVIGGESKQSEKARLRKGVNILVATPGRLVDHLRNTEVLDVQSVRWLVLDEGDKLMELGFEEDIKAIVAKLDKGSNIGRAQEHILQLPSRRINILCSATLKMNVQRLGEISLRNAVHLQADPSDAKSEHENKVATTLETSQEAQVVFAAPEQLRQSYVVAPAKLRLVTLLAFLKRSCLQATGVFKAIVFMSCADSVDYHFALMTECGKETAGQADVQSQPSSELTKETIAIASCFDSKQTQPLIHRLHGSLTQRVRTATLRAFGESQTSCLMLCTDVASRGLDLPEIDHIIEYDPPFSADDHLHRVGRTARAGRNGNACIFLLPGCEEEYVTVLASNYREGTKALIAHTAEDVLRKGFGGIGREWEDRATDCQLETERWVLESPKYLEMARRAFQSHIRAYATHIATERQIFDIQALHLGHLAKAFGLRDKPGSIKVPGARPAKMTKADRSVAARKAKRGEQEAEKAPEGEHVRKQKKALLDVPARADPSTATRMKRKMLEHMQANNEFNIG